MGLPDCFCVKQCHEYHKTLVTKNIRTASDRRKQFRETKSGKEERILQKTGTRCHPNKYFELQEKEVSKIQCNLDLIDEKMYEIRKRMDNISKCFDSVRSAQSEIENQANELMKVYNEFLQV